VTPLTLFAFYAAVIGHEEKIKKKKKKKHHKLLGEVQCKGDYQVKSSEQIEPLDTSQWPLLLKVPDPLLHVVNSWYDATAITLILLCFRTLTSCVAEQITTPLCHLVLHRLRGTYVNMYVQDTLTSTSLPIQVLMK
jgi:hypothetical protein